MFVTNIEEKKFGAIKATINTDFCYQFIVCRTTDPIYSFSLSAIVVMEKQYRNVCIKRYLSKEDALLAHDQLMSAIEEGEYIIDADHII